MKLVVVHDALGNIQSVGKVMHEGKRGFGVLPKPGHVVTELEIEDALAKKSLLDIHRHCVVDTKQGRVVLRS